MKINTNLSSILVQNNLSKSTTALNKAIERMTTGYKLNHASDNAAGYSIAENMSSQLSSYQVAQDNIAMGMDLLATAQDTISLMQQHGERLMDLWTQAQNGTYGAQSLAAIQSEANARIAEINRLYLNSEYNGIGLLDRNIVLEPGLKQAGESGFIDETGINPTLVSETGFAEAITPETPQVTVTDPTQLLSAINSKTKIGIGNAETLAELAKIVNGTDGYSAKNCNGKTIILTEDIDLSAYSSGEGWTPIGTSYSKQFRGTFNGNGHTITNLRIDRENSDYQGLFGYADTGTLKNVALKDVSVKGKDKVGGLAGYAQNITNSYSTGSVSGKNEVGGLVGHAKNITNSYSTGNVSGNNEVGGLAGYTTSTITNSYSTASASGNGRVGGLAGYAYGTITNSYSTGSVSGNNNVGGLAGHAQNITSSYSTGSVSGYEKVGGLVGRIYNTIANSYSTGSVSGTAVVGGLVGYVYTYVGMDVTITNAVSYSNVDGDSFVGGLIGAQLGACQYYFDGELEDDYPASESGVLTVTGCKCAPVGSGGIGGFACEIENYDSDTDQDIYTYEEDTSIDLSALNSSITTLDVNTGVRTIQAGINGDRSSRISVNTALNYNLNISDISSSGAYNKIKTFLDSLSSRATELGAAANRLESALESTGVQIENLTSSRSTIKDADIAKESSAYIKSQILQQAAATLLATANQSPSIALQLL